jgi:hypothetical protein
MAPPAPTQPARWTPRAQTTASAFIVLTAMRLPASNREIIRYFMTVLLGLQLIVLDFALFGSQALRGLGRRDNGGFPRKHVSSIVYQALQPVRGDV